MGWHVSDNDRIGCINIPWGFTGLLISNVHSKMIGQVKVVIIELYTKNHSSAE